MFCAVAIVTILTIFHWLFKNIFLITSTNIINYIDLLKIILYSYEIMFSDIKINVVGFCHVETCKKRWVGIKVILLIFIDNT